MRSRASGSNSSRLKMRSSSTAESSSGMDQSVGSQGPGTYVASESPGQEGIETQMNFRSSSPTLRYWNDVPTGTSIAVPGTKAVMPLPVRSSRQISPCPSSTYQNSLTV